MTNIVPHINTGELRDANRVRKLLSSPDIHVAYLLGDGQYWVDYALAQPNIKMVVVRRWNIFNVPDGHSKDIDGHMHQLYTPEEVFNHFLRAGHGKYRGNKKVRWIWGWNEIVHNPNDPNRDLIQANRWQAKVGELFAANGYGAALGGYAAAKTNSLPIRDKNTWRTAWKAVLDVLAKYPDLLLLDWHEYEFAFLPINYLVGIDTPFPFSLLDKRIRDPKHWGSIPYSGAAIEHNWKLGNIANILEYNKELGHKPFPWGRGEWSFDTMTENWWYNNSIDGKKPLEQTWREMFGVAAKGVHTLFKYYAYLHDRPNSWTMDDHNKFIIEQAKWFKRNSGEGCLYNVHFAWNTNPYWRTEDISHPDYIPYIEWMQTKQHEVDTPTPPPTEPPQERTMRPIQIKGYNKATSTPVRVNIRTNPNATATILGQLPSDPVVTSCYVSESPPIAQGGWTWQYYEGVKTVAGTTVNGYMASELVEEITITTPPAEPKLFFDIKGLTYLKTQSEWDTFCVDVATLAALLPTVQGRE